MLALPIFPASHPASIVGADELNFCVRDGNRWTLIAINTNCLRLQTSNRIIISQSQNNVKHFFRWLPLDFRIPYRRGIS